jgi:hypothetical protein
MKLKSITKLKGSQYIGKAVFIFLKKGKLTKSRDMAIDKAKP